MARNEEKANSMLHRFLAASSESLGLSSGYGASRPKMTTNCTNINEAEKWRGEVIMEISRGVTKIQDSSLTDQQVRDLNDEINKLIREKRRWEEQIKNLGGPDYRRAGTKIIDNSGTEIPGNYGYRYFGRARDLPGVRELFEPEVVAPNIKSRFEMYQNIDADYFGYRDEDDEVLLEYEKQKQIEMNNNGLAIFDNEEEIDSFTAAGKKLRYKKKNKNKKTDLDTSIEA
ncbi:Isy1-like splicing factor [Neoconidiobolus thromboides FSU 785]|nr:Isy1-like splicing factor [Neoconidiobolus thromboides FSU 785]